MKYSSLFGKTRFGELKDSPFISHQLLTRAGFISESVAGRYFFLPLGWRVHEKMKAIIKKEMDEIGSQEMLSPTLHPLELWEETNRTSTTGFELMQVRDRRGAAFALGGTAEEMFVDVVRKQKLSYKDLPFTLYQFSNKFRDEMRARGGLLRVREFVMKDAYSFHAEESGFKEMYQQMAEAYTRIFSRLGLETRMVEADNGYIGGEYCHEFQVDHPEGEGRYFVSEDGQYVAHEDVAEFSLPPLNPDEELRSFEIISQPEWVTTMDDFEKQYGVERNQCLKNVVYRSSEGDLIIAVIRGDLEVNKTKLEHAVTMVGQLEVAEEQDLAAIGTKTGYVHSWGHSFIHPRKAKTQDRHCNVIYVADHSLKSVRNFIGGQKEETSDGIGVNYGRDFKHDIEADVAMAEEGFMAKNGHGTLLEKRGIEVGNIFQLGYHYSSLMKGATFVVDNGSEQSYYMGCYGIGLGRTMAAIVEKHHDERGIVWPVSIAPYQVHLVSLTGGEQKALELYEVLQKGGIDVLWDDRSASAGVKFADADLIGVPTRLVVSKKTADHVEWKSRSSQKTELLSLEEVKKRLHDVS